MLIYVSVLYNKWLYLTTNKNNNNLKEKEN